MVKRQCRRLGALIKRYLQLDVAAADAAADAGSFVDRFDATFPAEGAAAGGDGGS